VDDWWTTLRKARVDYQRCLDNADYSKEGWFDACALRFLEALEEHSDRGMERDEA
jgi:hypothetical protein